ncbi:MAG: DUF3086 domain-containing protein [Nostocaceae cyanobacterium]|nr:DUF3086 domain-containing protein [Nostocaceae cyanobacterium]
MNPEEYHNLELTDDLWASQETQNATDEQVEKSSVEMEDETTSDAETITPAQESTTSSSVEMVAQPEAETTILESQQAQSPSQENLVVIEAQQKVAELQQQKQTLITEIANLQESSKILQAQLNQTQMAMGKLMQEALSGLEQRKQALQISVEQLERRQERIRKEMRTTFAGASQELAIRVQGFKDYLTGSLQDLAACAEQLELIPPAKPEPEKPVVREREFKPPEPESGIPQFGQQQFQDSTKQIRRLIDQYRTKPDYYGPPWQLRRTFEPVHAERVSNWFFTQGGRGALRTMGSRLQNTLIASAIISILHQIYGNRVRTLVIANSPERLGDWRRGLQDCLGIGRPDFGPDRGVALFETPEAAAQKADRLVKANQLPLIIIDDSEDKISLSLLQFPLWLAFAPDPKVIRSYDDDF